MKITDISLNKVYDLKKENSTGNLRYSFGISAGGSQLKDPIELDYRISEIIDDKINQGIVEFELFLKEYIMDFEKMVQINKLTKFQRNLKLEKYNDEKSMNLLKEEQEEGAWIEKYPMKKNFFIPKH